MTFRFQLDLAPDRKPVYEEAIARLRNVEVAPDAAAADALITGGEANTRDLPCLLDRPETSDPHQLSAPRMMPAHTTRFLPSVRAVQGALAAGELGSPGLLRIHHWLPHDQLPHQAAFPQIDLAHWFFGAAPEQTHFLEKAGYLQAHLGFPDGGMAVIDVATNRPGHDSYYSMHLIGSTGAAYADDHHNAHLHFGAGGTRALLHQPCERLGMLAMLEEFVGGVLEGRPWSVTMLDTAMAHQCLKEVAGE